mgnify:CR=1 FL=1
MITDRTRPRPDDYFKDWKEREALAEVMIPMVGQLAREHSVKCYIYGKPLVKRMTYHGQASEYKMRVALSYLGPMRIELIEIVPVDFQQQLGGGIRMRI